MPVVRDERVVGIVSRENLLRTLVSAEHHHDAKPKEGVVARALEDALVPLKWRFERPRLETEPHRAPTTQSDDASSAAADFRRLVSDFESKELHRREELRL